MIEGQRDHFVKCGCDVSSHLVRFTYWPKTEKWPASMWIHFQLPPINSFWQRLKLAFRYLFRPNQDKHWGFWSEIEMGEKEILELEQFLEGVLWDAHFEIKEGQPTEETVNATQT